MSAENADFSLLDELDWQFIDLDGRFAAAERSSVWS